MTELRCEYLSVRCNRLYVLVMSRKHFRVNQHSIFAWMSRNFKCVRDISEGIHTLYLPKCQGTLKCVRDMTRTYSQLHRADKYSQHSSINWSVWSVWVFAYELSGFGFEFRCSHLHFRYRACLQQGVPWHSGKYRVWIHSEMRTWNDKDMQLITYLIGVKICVNYIIFHNYAKMQVDSYDSLRFFL